MKVAIYCRLSEEDRDKRAEADDSVSIQNQKAMLLQYAEERGWELYGIYSDDDYAGADRRRPEFNRLLKDAEAKRFDIVLCKAQSRFTRELELVEKYIHGLFPIWGIRFIGIVDNADTENKGNKKSRQINGLVNEWYLEDMSESIRSVLKNRRENGLHIGSFALYGYKKDPERKGHLIIDGEAAETVREVFTLFSEGYGKTAIARILNDRGIPNPTEYKRRQGLRYKGAGSKNSTLWRYTGISDMLTNEIYIGSMVQGRYGSVSYKTKQNKPRPKSEWYIVEGTHEPIIDRELWERVQSRLAQRAKPCFNGKVGIFANKARCANCGYALHSARHTAGKAYLQCPNRHIAKDSCEGAHISVSRLERAVVNEINRLSGELLDKDELAEKAKLGAGLENQRERVLADIKIHRAKSEECSKAIRALYMDKAKGLITEGDFSILSRELLPERERHEERISEGERRLSELEEKIKTGDSRRELVERYTKLEHLEREVVEALIDYISVGKRLSGTWDVPIEIHWTF